MRVTPAFSPISLHRIQGRAPVLAGLLCAAMLVSGCANQTVLGEKPTNATSAAPVVPDQGAQTTSVTRLQKFMWFFSPYRPVIQQGNFISEEMLSQLKVGMTRDQVRFILGTPLLTDIFHADRWDYPFRLAKGNGEVTSSRVVVFFKDDKVEHFEGGNLPTEKEYIARIAGPAPVAKKDSKGQVMTEPLTPAEQKAALSAPTPASPSDTTSTPAIPATAAPASGSAAQTSSTTK
jgi:outer membrane protein assembly factor BamE